MAVSAHLAGLELGAEYHFRLNAGNANTDAYASDRRGADSHFKLESPPTIESEWTASVSSSEALLEGSVDPQGFESSYRFEYVNDATYGESGFEHAIATPEGELPATVEGKASITAGSATLSELSASAGAFAAGQAITGTGIPAGATILAVDQIHRTLTISQAATSGNGKLRAIQATGPQPVSQRLTGLAPGATYHWRIVATNEVGEAEGAPRLGEERHFTTNAEQEAPAADSCPNAALRGGASAGPARLPGL